MFTIGDAGDLGDIDDAHTVFVPNRPDTDTPTHPAVIKAVQRAHQRGARNRHRDRKSKSPSSFGHATAEDTLTRIAPAIITMANQPA